jgi:pyridoxal phosphate enzyme (YggS family)
VLPLDDSLTSGTIAGNVQRIREGIRRAALRVGRDPSTVQLVAATKTVPPSGLFEAYAAGVRIFGENRLQEAQGKMPEIGPRQDLAWHFIGRMQSRKLKDIVGNFAMIHSVESVEQIRSIAAIAEKLGIRQDILMEVNVAGEETKGGFLSKDVPKAVEDIGRLPHVTLRGLMTLPPFGDNPDEARPYFSKLRQLRDSLVKHGAHAGVEELSMGMSHDYQIAIEEGATMVRIGTAIFGKRG